jgi:hypothetical protein
MIRLSSLCPAYLFSFRFVRLLKLALPTPRDVDALNWRDRGLLLGQVAFGFASMARQLPHASWRTRDLGILMPLPASGIANVPTVSGYLPARNATTIHPIRRWNSGSA